MAITEEEGKSRELVRRAKLTLGDLYPTEVKLLTQAPKSSFEWVGAGPTPDEADNDPIENGACWQKEREVRSKVLRWLCVDDYARKQVDIHGVNLLGAKITGQLDFSYLTIHFPLWLQRCYLEQWLNLYQSELAALILSGSYAHGISLADSRIGGDLVFDQGFRCDGELNMELTRVAGKLDCTTAFLRNPNSLDDSNSGIALNAAGAIVEGGVFLDADSESDFRAEGEVRFARAKIQNDFSCAGGKFSNLPTANFRDGAAIHADGISVSGSIFLRFGFHARGAVWLHDAQIGETLDCEDGTFENPYQKAEDLGDEALTMDRANVKGSVFFRSGEHSGPANHFSADGTVSMIAANIGGTLDLQGGDFENALLDLRGVTVASFEDGGPKTWPKQDKLFVTRFKYGYIYPSGAELRLRWLSLQPYDDFSTEPYVQLANALQQSGDDDGARTVLQRAAELKIKHDQRHWYLHPDNLFTASIGYGYRPIWAVGYISIMSALGWIIYRRAYLAGTIQPTDKDAYNQLKSTKSLPPYYPPFAPLMFSLENSLPLVKLGQADKWQPDWASSLARSGAIEDMKTSASPLKIGDGGKVEPAESNSMPSRTLDNTTGETAFGTRPVEGDLTSEQNPRFVSTLSKKLFTLVREYRWKPLAVRRTPEELILTWVPSARFLKWVIWIQILLGWLFATLFVAGVTGIVRKQ